MEIFILGLLKVFMTIITCMISVSFAFGLIFFLYCLWAAIKKYCNRLNLTLDYTTYEHGQKMVKTWRIK